MYWVPHRPGVKHGGAQTYHIQLEKGKPEGSSQSKQGRVEEEIKEEKKTSLLPIGGRTSIEDVHTTTQNDMSDEEKQHLKSLADTIAERKKQLHVLEERYFPNAMHTASCL